MDRQGKLPSYPPVETEDRYPEEELLPMIRIITWMMDEQERRFREDIMFSLGWECAIFVRG